MPVLIVARGAGSQGKTSTIKRVLQKIGVRLEDRRGDIRIAMPGYWVGGDHRETSIALASGGDTKQVVKGHIEFFVKDMAQHGLPAIMIMGCKGKTDDAEPYQEVLKFVERHEIEMIIVHFQRRSGEDKEAYFDRKAEEILSKFPK